MTDDADELLQRHERLAREHAAWLDVGQEFANLGLDLNRPEIDPLARAIRKWGEELHQLRLADPQYDAKALDEARAAYSGQFERGTYPERIERRP